MKFDKYGRTARLYPSLIILIPFLVFTINCNIDGLDTFFDDLLKVKIYGNITISVVLLYLLIQVNRFIGKFLFEKNMFKGELEMPTTKFLLFSNNEFSHQYKQDIRGHALTDFGIIMPSEQDESDDLEEAKKRIVETVGRIRQKVKNGRLLLQHNIEYGFARNLIGGSILGFLVSIIDSVYFFNANNQMIGWFSVACCIFFGLLLLIHKPIIIYLGKQYAKRLFQEYIQE